MTPEMAKAMHFLKSFDSAESFVAYCEGQGITGIRMTASACLVAVAVNRVLGLDATNGVLCDSRLRMGHEVEPMPEPIVDVLWNFDGRKYPHLESHPWPP